MVGRKAAVPPCEVIEALVRYKDAILTKNDGVPSKCFNLSKF